MKLLDLSVGTMVMRLHAMCAIMVTLGFFGLMYVGIVIGMVLFLTTLMGIKWSHIKQLLPVHHVHHAGDMKWHDTHRHHPAH